MPVHVVPHFAYASGQSVAKREERRAAARQRLGFSLRDFVMVSARFVTANKQYDAILTALAQLPAGLRARVLYVIAGEVRPEEYVLHQDIARLELQDHVSVLGFVDETSLEQLLVAA